MATCRALRQRGRHPLRQSRLLSRDCSARAAPPRPAGRGERRGRNRRRRWTSLAAGQARGGDRADLESVVNIEEVDALFEFTDTAPARIDELRRAVRDLAHEYETASAWLADAVAVGWSSVKGMRPAPRCASILDEGHRIIAKDWLTADMTLLIGWLLRRATKSLDRMDLSPVAVRCDLGSQRSYEAMLRSVAEMLDRAGALATESVAFLGEMDQRLHLFRQQVASVVAHAQDVDPAPHATPRR